jgi:hypothetical protein
VSVRNFLSADKLGMFDELLSKCFPLIQHSDFFKLNLLITLTNPILSGEFDVVTQKFLSGLHFKYRTILRRKIKWKNESFPIDSTEVFARHEALTQLYEQYLKRCETHWNSLYPGFGLWLVHKWRHAVLIIFDTPSSHRHAF